MGESGIYVIHIIDPDSKQVLILSIDRRYAHSAEQAIEDFKQEFPFPANWLVKAKPTWLDEPPTQPNNSHTTRHQAGFLRRRNPDGNRKERPVTA